MVDGPSNVISMSRIELVVDPEYGDLWTGPAPAVRGTHFPPIQEVGVEVVTHDGKGRKWRSKNVFLVSAEGIFDTSVTAASGDDYYGIAPEGPMASMLCADGPGHDFSYLGVTELHYRFAVFDGDTEIWSQEITRRVGRPERELLTPEVRVLYYDDQVASDGGFTSMALSSYGIEVVPETRSALASHPRLLEHGHDRTSLPTYIVASGRASGKALEDAMRRTDIKAVILFSGGGLRFDPYSDFRLDADGEMVETPLEFIPLDHASMRPRAEGIVCTRTLYAEAVADRTQRERGRIEVEKIPCPIFMFSGADDQIWPSSAFSELVAQRRKMANCPFPTYHRTFEGVGHDIGPSLGFPTLPTSERTISHPDTGFRLLLGGKMGRTARARRECWDSLLSILNSQPLG